MTLKQASQTGTGNASPSQKIMGRKGTHSGKREVTRHSVSATCGALRSVDYHCIIKQKFEDQLAGPPQSSLKDSHWF